MFEYSMIHQWNQSQYIKKNYVSITIKDEIVKK
jgi:hypothetical protein